MKILSPKILTFLSDKTGKAIRTIRKDISLLKRKFPTCTSNAVAHIYASQHGLSILQKLDEEDKKTIPNFEIEKSKVILPGLKSKPKIKIRKVIDYNTNDHFIKGHIEEINLAYTKGCYTCVNILARKIIENLIVDILKRKYPPINKQNKELYFYLPQARIHDLNIILANFQKKRTDFNPDEKKIIERLVSLVKKIKSDANDKTHSWYYLVESKKEIDELQLQTIIELIKKIEISVGDKVKRPLTLLGSAIVDTFNTLNVL